MRVLDGHAIQECLPLGEQHAFHIMAKPTGPACNLDCAYCYYLPKAALYAGSSFRMSDATAEAYLRQLLESARHETVTVAWQGGEPTLAGLDFYRRSIDLVELYRQPGQVIEYTIQTNGTLINEEWCDFFAENGFLVGLSMDGPPEIHNRYRVDRGGHPTHSRVLTAARLMSERGVDFNVLCAVHAANQSRGVDVYRYFRDEIGARFLQFIPIVERATGATLPMAEADRAVTRGRRSLRRAEGNPVTSRSVTPDGWGGFLSDVFDEWVRRNVGEVFVQQFEAALAAWAGMPPAVCVYAETCGGALALEHNGDLYSCDHFVEPRHLLGNIRKTHMADLVASAPQRAFGTTKRDSLPRYCRECPVLFACHGECPRNRFVVTPGGKPGLNYLCSGYRTFFRHIDRPMRLTAELLRRGRLAAEIMALLSSEPPVAVRDRNTGAFA